MDNLIKYIGLVNLMVFILGLLFLTKKSKTLNLKKDAISKLANNKKFGIWFNILLIIFAIGQVIFAREICIVVLKNLGSIALPLFYAGGLALLLASIFPIGKYRSIHMIMAGLSAILVGTGVIIISILVSKQNTILGLITLFATFLIPISYLLRKRLPGAQWEIILFGSVMVWNIVLSYLLILKF